MSLPYVLGTETKQPLAGSPGFFMRFNRDARRCVVFLGYPDYDKGPNAIRCEGTGFLITYKGGLHLITARHVAEKLGDDGWATRVNKLDGTCKLIPATNVPWVFHPDDTVDIAVCGLLLSRSDGFDFLYADGDILFLKKEEETVSWVELGDMCYTVGLWRLLEGKERNLPVVHTGHIARLPGEEKIPVRAPGKPGEREMVDGYLIEAQTLSGLSGSPVFIRPSCNLQIQAQDLAEGPEAQLKPLSLVTYREHVKLIGLWQAAWNAPAGEVLTAEHGQQTTVPVGMGIVVPASKIIEVLELPAVEEKRKKQRQKEQESWAQLQSVSSEKASTSIEADNAEHKAHFTALLNAAAQKKKPDDQT